MTAASLKFNRTHCACDTCRVGCHTMPGMLVPSDLATIATHLGHKPDEKASMREFAARYLRASDGIRILIRNRITSEVQESRVPTIVPRQQEDGQCVFLSDEGHCTIHAVSPFGCAYQDSHLPPDDSDKRTIAAIEEIVDDRDVDGVYQQTIDYLRSNGLIARPLADRRRAYQDAYTTAETLGQYGPSPLKKPLDHLRVAAFMRFCARYDGSI